jgi:hypothetical protein
MSPQESQILWCLVEGDPMPYYVRDIPIGINVTQLKELITLSIVGRLGTLGQEERLSKSHNLKLWKVVSLIPRACAF